jgi:tetratricopeptide (TPR) repeat protein
MNLTRPAGPRRWPRAITLAIAAAVLFPAIATAASASQTRGRSTAKTGKAPASRKAETPVATPAPRPGTPALPEFADAYPSEVRPTPPDLLLRPEGERKAQALRAFAEGLLAEDAGNAEGMLAGYRRTLDFDPGYAELAVKVAVELARRGDPSSGIQILKDAAKAAPKEALPNIYLAQFYARFLKKPDFAEKHAIEALKLEPENFAAHLALHEVHTAAGDDAKAAQVLERAAASPARDPKFWTQLGALYRRVHLKEDGSAGEAELKKMNAVHLKAAQLGPTDATVLTEVADYFVLSKQVKEAIPYYLAVLALPQASADPQVANVRDKLARCYVVTGQRDAAIDLLEKLAKENALRLETYEMLGKLYHERSEAERAAGESAKADASRERAVNHLQYGLLLDSSNPQNHVRLAQLMMEMGQWDRAAEAVRAAVAKFPDVPSLKFILGRALSQARRHTEALAAFAETQADAKLRNEDMLNAGFYFYYGAAAEQAGLTEKAAELLKQSLQLQPDSHEAMNYLGYMWVDRGENLDEAGELIKRANELERDNGAYLDSLGWYYYQKGEYELALKELLRAAEIIPQQSTSKKGDPVVYDHIGDTYARLGRTREALDYWNRAVAVGIDDPKLADRVREKIEDAKQKLAQTVAPAAEAPQN